MDTKTLTATDVPFSSVVGKAVMLTDQSGAVVAQIGVMVPNVNYPYRETAEAVAAHIITAWNTRTPHPAPVTAREAVPSALRYVPTVTTDNCRTPPQPSETVAEALHEIRAAIRDGNLSQGVRLDIIEKIALRALKGGEA